MNEFEPLETLKHKMRFGMNYVNILILDAGVTTHVAVYDFEKQTFKNFHTNKEIDIPLMWCELPNFNVGIFDALVERLN